MFQDKAPLLRKHAHPARTQTRTLWPSTWLLLKAMGAGPAGRITYAAASRLDGIGRRAIGDMVSSACSVELKWRWCFEPAQALSRERGSPRKSHAITNPKCRLDGSRR